jgi:hypothetical protein
VEEINVSALEFCSQKNGNRKAEINSRLNKDRDIIRPLNSILRVEA